MPSERSPSQGGFPASRFLGLFLALPWACPSTRRGAPGCSNTSTVRKRSLGRSGIAVGELGLGTWGLSGESYGPVSDAGLVQVLEAATDEGCTFFETAACYREGRVETCLGQLARGHGRDRLVLSTRIGVDRSVQPPRKRFETAWINEACEASLRRFDTDHVDVLVLHNPRLATVQQGAAIDALVRLRQAGKTRLVGVSIGAVEVGRAALACGVDVLVLPYNLLHPGILHELSGEIAARETAVVVRSPLAYGLLADTWDGDRPFSEDDHRHQRWTSEELARRIRQRDAARLLVHAHVRSLREAALRYVLANGLVSVVVPGARTSEQARQNARSADVLPYLLEDDLARLGQALARGDVAG